MLGHLIEESNEAWRRKDEARACTNELEFYVEDIEEYNNNLHEELHVMRNRLHPYDNPAGAAEMDAVVILADGGEPDEENEEEEDPEELVLIDDSGDEGGCVSRMDSDHDD
jgi:hypothetical protein